MADLSDLNGRFPKAITENNRFSWIAIVQSREKKPPPYGRYGTIEEQLCLQKHLSLYQAEAKILDSS